MAFQIGDLRAALISAGASDDMASRAATEVATYENRLAVVDTRLSVLTWIATTNCALTVAVLFKLFHGI